MNKVLLVEDELSLRELYADFLKDVGYSVDVAADGETAIGKINQGDWDILLLDIMLPRLDGIEILKSINANSILNQKPVLIMSNLEDPSIIQKCLDNGAKEFLAKAELTPPDIIKAIERYVKNGSAISSI
ncbi:MAG: response regulator [Patescibacteria group bacterium]|jgi:DNA-binding response OmpR family regulator